jgi:hypothetical protein
MIQIHWIPVAKTIDWITWTPASEGVTDRVFGLPAAIPETVGYNIIRV